MIGQTELLNKLEKQIQNDTLPRFIIFTGAKGSGKKTITKELCKLLNVSSVMCDIKIDSIREIIDLSYKCKTKTVYTIYDADKMSINAKNSLLKVTEEPPNNAYFVMTLEDENNTLDTIKSRATIYRMNRYKKGEILEYAQIGKEVVENSDVISELCEVPYEVDLLYKYGPLDFYNYVEKVVDNIATVSGANVFKIAEKISLKDNADGYDLKLFWKCFNKVLYDRRTNMSGIKITSKYISELRVNSINKAMLFDMWILAIRKEWLSE